MADELKINPYQLGHYNTKMPNPANEEHCIPVDAGAVQLVVESRRLTNDIVNQTFGGTVVAEVSFDDYGASLHVLGTADGLEHLRFDCFENEPHYHYIDHAAGANTVVRIDELAVGDPIEFSLACVEHHLADMLGHCGVAGLADDVAAQGDQVDRALVEVRELMRSARQPVG